MSAAGMTQPELTNFVVKWDFDGPGALRAALYLQQYTMVSGIQLRLVRDPVTGKYCVLHMASGINEHTCLTFLDQNMGGHVHHMATQCGWKTKMSIWVIPVEDYLGRLVELLQNDATMQSLANTFSVYGVVPAFPGDASAVGEMETEPGKETNDPTNH